MSPCACCLVHRPINGVPMQWMLGTAPRSERRVAVRRFNLLVFGVVIRWWPPMGRRWICRSVLAVDRAFRNHGTSVCNCTVDLNSQPWMAASPVPRNERHLHTPPARMQRLRTQLCAASWGKLRGPCVAGLVRIHAAHADDAPQLEPVHERRSGCLDGRCSTNSHLQATTTDDGKGTPGLSACMEVMRHMG